MIMIEQIKDQLINKYELDRLIQTRHNNIFEGEKNYSYRKSDNRRIKDKT